MTLKFLSVILTFCLFFSLSVFAMTLTQVELLVPLGSSVCVCLCVCVRGVCVCEREREKYGNWLKNGNSQRTYVHTYTHEGSLKRTRPENFTSFLQCTRSSKLSLYLSLSLFVFLTHTHTLFLSFSNTHSLSISFHLYIYSYIFLCFAANKCGMSEHKAF